LFPFVPPSVLFCGLSLSTPYLFPCLFSFVPILREETRKTVCYSGSSSVFVFCHSSLSPGFFFSSPSVFFFLSTVFSSLCFLFPAVRDLFFFSPSRSSFSLASSVSLRRNRGTKVCSWLSSRLCIMSVRRGKGVAQPETRLALLCQRNRGTKVCSWLSSRLCIMSVRRGKGVAQPETRLALLCWLANAPHCFCLSSLLSLGSPGFVFVFPLLFCSSAVLNIYRQENALATPKVIVQPLG